MDVLLKNFPELKNSMKLLEKKLGLVIPTGLNVLYEASKHLIKTDGKMLRPLLTILSFKAVSDGNIERVIPLSMAIELIHTACLIHDDIIDKSLKRRWTQSVSAKWGNDVALITGDALFSKAFGLITTYENAEIGRIVLNNCVRIAEGQILEIIHTRDMNVGERGYLEIVKRKTAALFEACTRSGAVLGNGSKKEIKALSNYGNLIGIGFQIKDDILDITSTEEKVGKSVCQDILLGRPTFVIIHALKAANRKNKNILKSILQKKCIKDMKRIREVVRNTNSVDYAREKAESFVIKAKKELVHLKDSNAKNALEAIADFTINREF